MKKKLKFPQFLLIFSSISCFLIGCDNWNDNIPPNHDTITITKINEHNEYIDENGYKNDIYFTKICKSHVFIGEKDPSKFTIFILEGYIDAKYFSFELENAYLEISCKNIKFSININEKYSSQLSDVVLTFDNNKSEMNGDFSVVFILDGENIEKFDGINDSDLDSLQFFFNIDYWGKDKARFEFDYSEMVVEKDLIFEED